jgi:GT2 family glycosyltransferase
MTLDVVIPTRNSGGFLAQCLGSLADQTRRAENVFVVADGPDVDVDVNAFPTCLSVALCRLPARRGFACAVNAGIGASVGELVLILNDDAMLDRRCLEELEAVAISSDFSSFAPLVRSAERAETIDSAGLLFTKFGYGNRLRPGKGARQPQEAFEVFGPCGAAALYRRVALERVGLFREDFVFGFEDLDMACRLQLAGEGCLCVPSALVSHSRGGTIRQEGELRGIEAVSNSLLTAIECVPTAVLKTTWPAMVRFYLWFMWQFVVRGHTMILCRGLVRLIRRLPGTRHRRAVRQRLFDGDTRRWNELLWCGPLIVEFPDSPACFSPRER